MKRISERGRQLVDWPMRYLVLIALALIIASGISIYIINRNSPVAQAQVDPSQLYISPNAPAIEGGWQDNLYHGQHAISNSYSGDYDLWEYRENIKIETTATSTDGVKHTHEKYYQYVVEQCIWHPAVTAPIPNTNPVQYKVVTPAYWESCVKDRDQNNPPAPFENNIPTGYANRDEVINQTPYLVLGSDWGWERVGLGSSRYTGKNVHGKSTDFYDPILELDLWIPQSNTVDIRDLSIKAIDLCNHDGDHPDIGPPSANTYVRVHIKGKSGEQSIPMIDGGTQCGGKNKPYNIVDSIVSPDVNEIGAPIETDRTFYLQKHLQGIKYERYRIVAKINENSLYINQFKLEVSGVEDSFLVVPKTEGNADTGQEKKHTLNLSNRIIDTDNNYSEYKKMWEVKVHVAPDAKHGCSYETEGLIGIFDSDWSTSVVSWMKNNGYNPRVDVYSADRNDFLDGKVTFTAPDGPPLEFDGESWGWQKERTPNGNGADVSQNAWEDKIYDFRGDKIYKLHFYNIAQGTWIQLRIPFDQINALEKCIRKPLVKVYYSDISAGGRFGLGDHLDACVNDDLNNGIDASVYTHGTGEIGKNAHGSSAQYGVRVHDKILGFYSNFPPSPRGKGPPTISVKELTFANTVAVWGGQFGGRGRCMSNYWRGANRLTAENIGTLDIGDNTDPLEIENNTGKLYEMNPPGLFQLTNSRPTEDLKLRVSVYVDGDLSIKNNILNTRGDLEKFNEIGYIYLIAKGNIFIDPSVTQIDAILVAYTEDNSTGGRIFTCDFDSGGINIKAKEDLDLNNPIIRDKSRDYDNACNQKLTINGALIGREIHLGRTFCEVVSPTCAIPDPDQVGEEINLSPEYFVGIPQLPEFSEWLYNSDSVTILPANF